MFGGLINQRAHFTHSSGEGAEFWVADPHANGAYGSSFTVSLVLLWDKFLQNLLT